MSEQQSPDSPTPPDAEHAPNFELPRHGAIHEDNWVEYEAMGFTPIVGGDMDFAQTVYGPEHVYSGDKFSWVEGRPLRHKPGTSIYVSPEGIKLARERKRESEEWLRQKQAREDADSREKPGKK